MTELTDLFRRELERGLDALEGEAVTMDRIEETVERVKTEVGREVTQRILDRQPDEASNRAACPTCGQDARFHSTIRRLLITRHGEASLVRRWYRCGCGRGFSRLDQRLGLDSGASYHAWVTEWSAQFTEHVRRVEANESTVLDPYGATNRAEFLAVATEAFFDVPVALEHHEPNLYEVMRDFYKQDPAERIRHDDR